MSGEPVLSQISQASSPSESSAAGPRSDCGLQGMRAAGVANMGLGLRLCGSSAGQCGVGARLSLVVGRARGAGHSVGAARGAGVVEWVWDVSSRPISSSGSHSKGKG